jgi:hypothetical protein
MSGTLTYRSAASLSRVTKPLIIDRALKACQQIRSFKTRSGPRELSAEQFLARARQNATSRRDRTQHSRKRGSRRLSRA